MDRRFITLALVAVATAGLSLTAGCKSNGDTSGDDDAATTETEAETEGNG